MIVGWAMPVPQPRTGQCDVLSNILKQDDLVDFFSRSAWSKGSAYQAQGRVSALEVSDDLTQVHARVRGSERTPYRVDIFLKYWHDELDDIDGDCTCPVGYNCKHVAAALVEALRRKGTATDAAPASGQGMLPGSARPQPAPVLPPELNDWLEKVGGSIRGNDYPADVRQRLLYCVQPHAREGRMPHLAVSLLSVKLRKDGTLSDHVSRSNPGSDPDRAPAFYRDADQDIVVGLAREYRTYGHQDAYLIRSVGLFRSNRGYRARLLARPQAVAVAVGRDTRRPHRMASGQQGRHGLVPGR
jgi:hypothetical protein